MNKWKDPKKELPEENIEVWIAIKNGPVLRGYRQWMVSFKGWFVFRIGRFNKDQVIGWKEIEVPEHPKKVANDISKNQTEIAFT